MKRAGVQLTGRRDCRRFQVTVDKTGPARAGATQGVVVCGEDCAFDLARDVTPPRKPTLHNVGFDGKRPRGFGAARDATQAVAPGTGDKTQARAA